MWKETDPPRAKKCDLYTCQSGSHIVKDIIWNPLVKQLWLENEQNWLTFPLLYHHTFVDRSHWNHYLLNLEGNRPYQIQNIASFDTCQTGSHIFYDVIWNLGYPECNAKVNKMAPKYWNFCDGINVQKYTLKLS